VAVIILNVDPGGCSPEKPMPAKPSISPVRGWIATTPPSRPPSAVTAACSTGSEIVVRTAGACCGRVRRSTRVPASSSPPGRPISRSSKIRSRPETPTSASDGTPSRPSSSRRSGGIGPSVPTTCEATGDDEARSSPLASTVRLRASSVARGGICVTRRRRSPAARPGKTRARDQSTPSPVVGRTSSPSTVPNARVGMLTGTRYASPSLRGLPVTTLVAVAVRRALS
jgi:hypothetical protein